ncbi:MAG: HlyD family efflux transporter periplasmic adaptor subunit [Bdellovibrionales bacterium]|nr:HlyD family efflux transporter periplasmic adaptor subunit [Ramlibacter sp.]
MLSHAGLEDCATAMAVEIAQLLACERVSVGLLRQERVTVVATSLGHELQSGRDAATRIAAAMHEALDQSTSISHPAPQGGPGHITLAQQSLAGGTGAACSIPLKGVRNVVGALTLEREARAFSAAELALAEDLASFAGPVLEMKALAARSIWQRSRDGLAAAWSARRASSRWAAVGALVAVVLAGCFVPVPYRVSAPARLEGSVQRAIVASADGFLQQANVRAGDTVKEGQVLAEMASQDLQLERQRRDSEMRQHENAYKAAQSRSDRTQMVISQSKAGEAQAMLALIDNQIERARIVAPFDGVVIKGDLSQNLGAPVQRGEVLLTLAPNNSYRIIIEVDESDIAGVKPGQRGRIALAAMPDRPLEVTTRRVVPVATSADARNYFEVEASLDSPGAALRPGLRGIAKIDAGERSVAWQLAHRPLDWLRLAWWSL